MSLLEQLDQGAMEVTDCVDDGIFGTDAFQAQSCLLVHIGEALSSLPERDAYVLKRCFGLVDGCEAKLKDIGSELSLTPSRVAQIRDVALERLRHDRRYSYLREYAPAMVDQI